jgi:hypothetical protein
MVSALGLGPRCTDLGLTVFRLSVGAYERCISNSKVLTWLADCSASVAIAIVVLSESVSAGVGLGLGPDTTAPPWFPAVRAVRHSESGLPRYRAIHLTPGRPRLVAIKPSGGSCTKAWRLSEGGDAMKCELGRSLLTYG